jgi:hypothetical protein
MHRAPRRPLLGRETGIGGQLPGIECRAHRLDLGEHPCRRPPADSGNQAEQLLLPAQLGGLLHLLLDQALGLGCPLWRDGRVDNIQSTREAPPFYQAAIKLQKITDTVGKFRKRVRVGRSVSGAWLQGESH